MSETAPSPKKANLLSKLLIPVVFIAGAAAGGFGAAIGVMRFAPAGHAAAPPPPEPTVSPLAYVELEGPFTANLLDTGRFLQVRLSVSTLGGERVKMALEANKPAVAATVLSVLGECAETDVADRRGKDALRRRLREALNQLLKSRGEPVGVEDVLVTSLVVQ